MREGINMSSNLYVGNLPFDASGIELRSLLMQAGAVESIRIVTEQYAGESRGFAFVEMATEAEAAMATEAEAAKAFQLLNRFPMKGRNLAVSWARQEQRRGGTRLLYLYYMMQSVCESWRVNLGPNSLAGGDHREAPTGTLPT
jgi:RNA recognition motif-containing protein